MSGAAAKEPASVAADIDAGSRSFRKVHAGSRRASTLCLCLALLAITYGCHFLRSASFGLYEDDYRSIGPWMGAPMGELWKWGIHCILSWPQGRPLNHLLPALLASSGYALGGLHMVYLLAFLLLAINVLLVFRVVTLLHGDTAGFLAALFMCCIRRIRPASCSRIAGTCRRP